MNSYDRIGAGQNELTRFQILYKPCDIRSGCHYFTGNNQFLKCTRYDMNGHNGATVLPKYMVGAIL